MGDGRIWAYLMIGGEREEDAKKGRYGEGQTR
jgi:hypothetical protein